MRFGHILHALYCEPWLIDPAMHQQLRQIVDAHITGKAHAPDGNILDFNDKSGKAPDLKVVDGVAIVSLVGVVGKRIGMMEKSSGVMDVDDLSDNIQAALDRDDVRGILLDVNSPGGTITGVPEAADMVVEAASMKPVVAFTDTLMASAAYWIAVGADAIVATQSASIGSIGVYSAMLDSSVAFSNAGLKQELFKEGAFKAMGIQGLPLTAEQREHIQERVTKIYEWFTSSVIEARVQVSKDSMQGQTFRGADAKAANLIDQIGSKDDAFDLLKELIG